MPMRDDIIAAARGWIGTPYRHQASVKGAGCDCLGLIRGVWRELYGAEPETVPAYSQDWAEAPGPDGRPRETLLAAAMRNLAPVDIDTMEPGDLLLFRVRPRGPAKHCAILATQTTMIHAYSGHRVMEQSLSPWWRRRLVACFRFPELG